MPSGKLAAVLRQLRRVAGPSPVQELTDAQLLARYATDRDEEAFATLLRRYGRLVRSVCRRVLRQEQDIDDAFQVTFMVFATKATSIRKTTSVASWLYGVAYRTAMNAKRARQRRSEEQREVEVTSKDEPITEAALRELQAILDHEVQQLPEKYRAPFVLCCLEGKSRAEAAKELGWKEGTVSCRLARARQELQQRLARRGVGLTAALCAVEVSRTEAAVAPVLVNRTLEVALSFAAGKTMAVGLISAEAATLAKAVLRGVVATKLKVAMAVGLAVGLMTGAAVIAHQALLRVPTDANADREPGPMAQAVGQPKPEAQEPAGTDPFGDPLPPGALARMGTVRLRQLYPWVVFSPDGKTLISVGSDHMVRTWDLAKGKYLHERRLDGTQHLDSSAITLAPDGKALVAWRSDRRSLSVYEVATGKEIGQLPVRDDQLYRLALGPGGRTLATATDDPSQGKHFIRLWDVVTGSQRLLLEHARDDEHLAFSLDGKYLGVAGGDDVLRLWDVATGKLIHNLRAEARCVAFAPDGRAVACGNLNGTVQLWDVATGKDLAALRASPRHDIACVAFAPDGKVLAAGGQGGLCLWDVAARKPLRQLPDRMVSRLTFAPDGKVLAASGGSNIRLWDVATGKPLLDRPGHDDRVDALAVSSDSKVVASASYFEGTLCLWDTATGRLLHRMPGWGIAGRTICFSPDDSLLASEGNYGAVCLWEVATGKPWRRFPIPDLPQQEGKSFVDTVGLSPDGKRLAAIIRNARERLRINMWDTATGKLVMQRPFAGDAFSRFTPDTTGITVRTPEGLAIQDTITGKQRVAISGLVDLLPIAFSPDGQLAAVVRRKALVPVAVKGARVPQADGEVPRVILVEVATGRQVLSIEAGPTHFLAFSPDGRILATANPQVVRLWEVLTGKEIVRRPRHGELRGAPAQAAVTSIALFPQARVLATGLEDGTILEWDLAPAPRAAKQLSSKELDGLWADLAGPDARRAYRAIHLLVASPAPAITYLKAHLQPAVEVDGKRVQRLLADLDSEQFTVREAATKELAALGEQVEPTLRRALAKGPSVEVRRRVEMLLAASPSAPSAATLSTLRAIQVLEWIGTLEAQQVLRKLATGAPLARATRTAKTSLERLAKRPTRTP